MVLLVEGQDRTLGERIARHIYVRKTNGDAGHLGAVADATPPDRAVTGEPAGTKDGPRVAKKNGGTAAGRKQKEGTTS